jgi:profilin
MSWQAYIDTSLVGTGKLDRAAIFGVEPPSPWASSPGFDISLEEVRDVIKAIDDPREAQSSGLHVQGKKYLFQTLNKDQKIPSLYLRKDKEGICIAKTKQAILISHYPETVQLGEAAAVVGQLADYLESVGY